MSFLLPTSLSSIRRTSSRTRLTVIPKLSTDLPYMRLCHLAHEISRRRCSLETIPFTAVDTGRSSASENMVYPTRLQFVAHVSHRRPPCSPTKVIPLDAEEMGVRAVFRLITNAMRLLANHTSTIFLCKVPGPRAIARSPGSSSSKSSRRPHSYTRTSLYITWTPSLSSLTASAHPAQRPTQILKSPAAQQQP